MENSCLIEVDQVDDANLVYIIDDHRGIGFTTDKYYPIYERNDQKFVFDNLGRDNYGVFSCVKTRLYKCDDYTRIHSYEDNVVDNKELYKQREIVKIKSMISEIEKVV